MLLFSFNIYFKHREQAKSNKTRHVSIISKSNISLEIAHKYHEHDPLYQRCAIHPHHSNWRTIGESVSRRPPACPQRAVYSRRAGCARAVLREQTTQMTPQAQTWTEDPVSLASSAPRPGPRPPPSTRSRSREPTPPWVTWSMSSPVPHPRQRAPLTCTTASRSLPST